MPSNKLSGTIPDAVSLLTGLNHLCAPLLLLFCRLVVGGRRLGMLRRALA